MYKPYELLENVLIDIENGLKYGNNTTIFAEFAHTGGENGLLFQLDAIAFRE